MNKPYRIAVLFPSIIPGGGSEQVLFNITRGFQQAGHQVVYFLRNPLTVLLAEDLPTPIVIKKSFRFLEHYAIAKAIKKEEKKHGQFDLILSNIQKRDQIPITNPDRIFYFVHQDFWAQDQLSYHNNPKGFEARIKHLKDYYDNKNIISVSEGATHSLMKHIHAKPRSIRTIYNPFDVELIRQLATAYPVTLNEPYLIHVARFSPQKRHDLLFDAYRRLKNPPKLVLLVAVTEPLKALIAEYGLTDQIILPGLQANPFPWIQQAKAMVFCSDFEGFGNVLVESLMCGTPVISTDCPSGPSEILTGDLAKWLVPVNNPQALADKLQEVLDHPYTVEPQHYAQFDMKIILPQYLNLIPSEEAT